MLNAKQAFNLAGRLEAAGHDVDLVYRPNGVDWRISVKQPDNNFWKVEENIPRVTPPGSKEEA